MIEPGEVTRDSTAVSAVPLADLQGDVLGQGGLQLAPQCVFIQAAASSFHDTLSTEAEARVHRLQTASYMYTIHL